MTLKEATAALHVAQQTDARHETALLRRAKNSQRRALALYRRVLAREPAVR